MRATLDLSLYLVTDTALCGPRGVPDVVRAAVAGGVTAVQVRAKDASDRERLALVRRVQDVLRDTGVALFVDDAVDLALIAGADGVHLGQSDLPAQDVRRLGDGARHVAREMTIDAHLDALERAFFRAARMPQALA